MPGCPWMKLEALCATRIRAKGADKRHILSGLSGAGACAFVSPPVACRAMFPVEFLCSVGSLNLPLQVDVTKQT
ncbi:hypothetical protein D3C73_1623060 [compost metagenome]